MKDKTKQLLLDAWDWCDEEDKSTEFMLQYMSDMSGMSYDSVVQYLASDKSNRDREKYYREKGNIEFADQLREANKKH